MMPRCGQALLCGLAAVLAGAAPAAHLALQAQAEDLDIVENLIVNKEQRVPDIEYSVRGGMLLPGYAG